MSNKESGQSVEDQQECTTRSMFSNTLIVIKGGGDLASGIALRLFRCGFPVIMTEIERPLAVRRAVSFAEAVYSGETTVESVPARCWTLAELSELAGQAPAKLRELARQQIPVVVDPDAKIVTAAKPHIIIDAIMAKRNLGTRISDAPIVVGLGPGFSAGCDCHAVIETDRGHSLGRVIWAGPAQADTGQPGELPSVGIKRSRVLRATISGHVVGAPPIGDRVTGGDVIANIVNETGAISPITGPFDGVLRGIIHASVQVEPGMKIGDVDPRIESGNCHTVSDKSLAIAGGVLEALLTMMNRVSSK